MNDTSVTSAPVSVLGLLMGAEQAEQAEHAPGELDSETEHASSEISLYLATTLG